MREGNGPCRINSVAATKIVIEVSDLERGPLQIGAKGALLHDPEKGPAVQMGETPAVRSGWSSKVFETATELLDLIEDHIAEVVFEEDRDDDVRKLDARDATIPQGIVEPDLGSDEDDTEQL